MGSGTLLHQDVPNRETGGGVWVHQALAAQAASSMTVPPLPGASHLMARLLCAPVLLEVAEVLPERRSGGGEHLLKLQYNLTTSHLQ